MTTYTEPYRASEIILSEANGTLSREAVTIASGSGVLNPGTVLGKLTVGGKYVPYDDGNADGSEDAAAILLEAIDATSADITASALVRFAEVKKDILQWDAAVDATAKTKAYADLAATPCFIVAR